MATAIDPVLWIRYSIEHIAPKKMETETVFDLVVVGAGKILNIYRPKPHS